MWTEPGARCDPVATASSLRLQPRPEWRATESRLLCLVKRLPEKVKFVVSDYATYQDLVVSVDLVPSTRQPIEHACGALPDELLQSEVDVLAREDRSVRQARTVPSMWPLPVGKAEANLSVGVPKSIIQR